jgi:hypothetical protein
MIDRCLARIHGQGGHFAVNIEERISEVLLTKH